MKYLCTTKCFIDRKLYKQDKFYEFAKDPGKHFERMKPEASVAKPGRPPKGQGKATTQDKANTLGLDSIV